MPSTDIIVTIDNDRTFCELCSRRIDKNTQATTWKEHPYHIHIGGCNPYKENLHRVTFLSEVKKRKHPYASNPTLRREQQHRRHMNRKRQS
jgi:hypothetical protein